MQGTLRTGNKTLGIGGEGVSPTHTVMPASVIMTVVSYAEVIVNDVAVLEGYLVWNTVLEPGYSPKYR
jgi:hypothetical protein